MSESVVVRRLAAPRFTHEHSSSHCVAEWGVSRFKGQANGFENLNCRRGSLVSVRMSVAPTHLHSAKQGKGTAFGDQRIVALVSVPQTMKITNVRL